jgi:hypothetical protein
MAHTLVLFMSLLMLGLAPLAVPGSTRDAAAGWPRTSLCVYPFLGE